MRLIDADDFIERLSHVPMVQEALRIAMDKMPTIEPERKKGKWIVYKAPDRYHCGLVKCQFCGEDMIAEADEYHFCPNCGAKMEGDQDETD